MSSLLLKRTERTRAPSKSAETGQFVLRLAVVGALLGALMSLSNVSIGAIGQGLALALVGVGVYISFRVLSFPDLSVDGSFPIGGAVAASLIAAGTAAEWSIPAALLAGALVGLCTALIHILFKIDGLLASIITMTGAYTFTLRIMGTSNIPLLNARTVLTPYEDPMREFVINTLGDSFRRQSNNMVEILVFGVIVAAALFALNWFMHTQIGLALRAAGKNTQMVRAVGLDDRALIVVGLMLSNGFAGLAGALAVQQLGFADVQMGVGIIVRGLAAVMIGEVLLRPRSIGQSVFAAVAGMVAFEIARAWVFAALNLNATDIRLVSALVVLTALAAPSLIARWRERRRRRSANAQP
ncbi:MAG: ABC transporter permease [Chloroflexi bacterium]|nr:ABC transporter permease [Chloroflexota bacterium]